MITTILFDLDETLYPPESGVMDQIRTLMLRYMNERLGLPWNEAEALRHHYVKTYGTTLRGLQINQQIDSEEYLAFVHDIPLHEHLAPNPELDRVLASVRQSKVIFTNASREHAQRVLDQLGIRHHFSHIVDIRDLEYESKPQLSAYRRICDLLQLRPEECLLVEDSLNNLRPAKGLGMVTVLVGDGDRSSDQDIDYAIRRIEEIGRVIETL